MSYTSLGYYIMVALLIPAYYLVPKKHRWLVLLAGSLFFYSRIASRKLQIAVMLATAFFSWGMALLIERAREARKPGRAKALMWTGILFSLAPLISEKLLLAVNPGRYHWVFVVGLSYYTLQNIAYLAETFKGKLEAQRSPLKYLLFVSFFPQVVQGPIPRYERIEGQLFDGNDFDWDSVVGGIQLILWGLFLKLVIADRASIPAGTVFSNYTVYRGAYAWYGQFMYMVQLYADFLACTTMSQGAAQLFGIRLEDNFRRPFFSESVQEIWRKWHISLSTWLRDYVYIPLGGSRKGPRRKLINLSVTFLVSGMWHGMTFTWLLWSCSITLVQLIQGAVRNWRERRAERTGCQLSRAPKALRIVWSDILFGLTVVPVSTQSVGAALFTLRCMFTDLNPWVWVDGSLLKLGLDGKELIVLFLALGVLMLVGAAQERGICVRRWLSGQKLWLRWSVALLGICTIWIFGIYGYGFNSTDFIYGGF